MSEHAVIGRRLTRVDALEKVADAAQYGADVRPSGMLYGKFVRGKHPHAQILRIDTSEAEKLPGVRAIVTQTDVIIGRRVFATDKVLYLGEPIAAVAATDADIAEEAADLIKIECQVLPVVQDVMEAIQPAAPRLHNDNTKDGPTRRAVRNILKKLPDDELQDHSADIDALNAHL